MTKTLKHKFLSSVADGTDATMVRPSNWNDDHDFWWGYRTVSTTTDTISNADHMTLIVYSNAAAVAATIAAPTTGPPATMPVGWRTRIRATGAGGVTLTGSGGATINGGASIAVSQGNTLDIHATGTNDYVGIPFAASGGGAGASAMSVNVQRFTSSGSYTPSANLVAAVVECVGAGGGGGGTALGTAGAVAHGGGGGAGSYSRKYLSAAAIGASQTITIGAGGSAAAAGNNAGGNAGDTSFGTLCIGKGGGGGPGYVGSGAASNGGIGGVAGTGDVVVAGANGSPSGQSNASGSMNISDPSLGWGAPSYFGGGAVSPAVPVSPATSAAGNPGVIVGTGASGGVSSNGAAAAAGAVGAPGLCIVTEYIAVQAQIATAAISVNVQRFTTSGTYTPSANLISAILECIGAGGAGGGVVSANNNLNAGGGGGGGYSRKYSTAAAIGASQSVTIGAGGVGVLQAAGGNGGDTSVGAICIAKGGSGAPGVVTAAYPNPSGGAGGIAGTGDVTVAGTPGMHGNYMASGYGIVSQGNGGAGPLGGGGFAALNTSNSLPGSPATGYGAGGGGAACASGAAAQAGGNGSPGLVVITEFIGIAPPPASATCAPTKCQIITASGTYVPSANTIGAIVEAIGGGGGGGGTIGTIANYSYFGAGGGSGSYSRAYLTAAQIGASQPVTIGAGGAGGLNTGTAGGSGGDTSFGTLCVGKGGSGGSGYPGGTVTSPAGAGGVPGTGNIVAAGNPGSVGGYTYYSIFVSTGGGASAFGGAAATPMPPGTSTGIPGIAANNYGSGGSGGVSINGPAAAEPGGNGSPGVVVVTEFLNAAPSTAAPPSAPPAALIGGRLQYVSATGLSYLPFNGNQIVINGSIYTISSSGSGVVGLTNISVFVEGVAGQSLAANTNYYVYAFNNAGTITADFSTTGHSTSVAAGNAGTEIKTGNETRTLLGMIRTIAAGQFADSGAQRFVISWLNRRPKLSRVISRAVFSGAANYAILTEFDASLRPGFLCWADDVPDLRCYTSGSTSALATWAVALRCDGADIAVPGASVVATSPSGGYALPITLSAHIPGLAEGYHYGQLFGGGSGYNLNIGYQTNTDPCGVMIEATVLG